MNKFKPQDLKHAQGIISIENIPDSRTFKGDLGLQISEDGRVWLCIDGIAFLRFKPLSKSKKDATKEFPVKGELKAVCTWGEGPDILLINEGEPYMLYDDPSFKDKATHGYSFKGSSCLSLKEAKKLVVSLKIAIKNVEELEASLLKEEFNNPTVER